MTAPVTLITGLPGNGKTLYTVCMVRDWAEKEGRQVYVHGIDILDDKALPWQPFEAEKWHELPVGAIIVIDEAHKTFPLRPVGSKTPPHVEAIAELRHQGHNLVLITQHPMELDSAVRRRVGRHMHVVRRFGMQAAAIFEWPQVRENCDKTRKDAIRHEWVYNKRAYGWYKSAELHTVKRRLPARLLWFPVMFLAIGAAIWGVLRFQSNAAERTQAIAAPAGASASAVRISSAGEGGGSGHVLSEAEYVASYQPRVPGMAYTAPAYDEVTKPVRAPYPAACVQSATRCQCYSQQGTRLDVPKAICADIAAGGFFIAWDEQQRQQLEHADARPVGQVVQSDPVAAGPVVAGINGQRPQLRQEAAAVEVEQDPARPRVRR